jgi:hypothetical protein
MWWRQSNALLLPCVYLCGARRLLFGRLSRGLPSEVASYSSSLPSRDASDHAHPSGSALGLEGFDNVDPRLLERVRALGYRSPTLPQQLTFPTMIPSYASSLIAAPTGIVCVYIHVCMCVRVCIVYMVGERVCVCV